MAVSSTSTRTAVGSEAGSPRFGSCCTKSDAASACGHGSSSRTPSMRTGTEIRRACKVLVAGAVWAKRFDPDIRTSSAALSPLVSPLSTAADYTVRALPANASSAQVTIAARSIGARIRLPLDELDLLLRLDRDLDGRVSDAELDAARAAVADYVTHHLRVAADDHPLPLSVSALAIRPDATGRSGIEVEARAEAASRIGSITIGSDFLRELDATHKTPAEIRINGRVETFAFQPGVIYERRIGVDWLMAAVLVIAAV